MNSGIYTAEMGAPPPEIDGGSAPPPFKSKRRPPPEKKPKPAVKTPVKKFAKGGSIDGCAQRGKTKGKMY